MAVEPEQAPDSGREGVRQAGALLIAGLALLLSISGIGDSNSTEAGARNNVLAADTFAWYQAKNIRQTAYQLARDDLETLIETGGASLSAPQQARLRERLDEYEAEIARYESEPDPADPDNLLKGEGKVQLLAQAQDYQEQRAAAGRRGNSFDYATITSGLGIVIASAGVLLASRAFLVAAAALGMATLLLLFNAALNVVDVGFFIT